MEKKTPVSDIRAYIRYGSENAISRKRLETLTGLADRKIRDMIAKANQDKHKPPIVNLGKGYFIATPDDLDDVSAYCNIETSRARQIEQKVRICRKWMDRVDRNQYRLEI